MTASETPHGEQATGLDLRAVVRAASLAPSSHNTQPWLFRLNNATLDLVADRTRALPVNDPDDRELTISCGCALFNIRVAAAAANFEAHVEPFPQADDCDILARVNFRLGAGRQDLAGLGTAIADRRTYRERFAPDPVEPDRLARLVDVASTEGAAMSILVASTQRLAAAALVAQGDAVQWANASWRRELAAWMHPRRRGDGLSVPTLAVPLAQLVVRTFDMGGGVGARDRQVADESPVLAVLSTENDEPQDWLMVGQALQRVLLTGVRLGLQGSYLNQPVQVAPLRTKLQQLTGRSGHAQLLLRMGVPSRTLQAAPRRAIDDNLVDSGGSRA